MIGRKISREGRKMEKREWQKIFLMAVAFIFAAGLLGCTDLFTSRVGGERSPEARLTTASAYRFNDIPAPSGMTLNRKESFIYETGATRTGLLVYEGKGELDQLAGFFRQQMPNYQWRLLSIFELKNVMLSFIKEGWISVIYIFPQESETRIEVRVGPVEIKCSPSSKN